MKIRITLTVSREFELDASDYPKPELDASEWDRMTAVYSKSVLDDPLMFVDNEDARFVVSIEELDASPARSMSRA